MKKRFGAPSPALVIAIVALFVALGGTSYAAFALPNKSVGTKQLKNGAVTAAKIHAGLTVPRAASPAPLAHGETEKGVFGFGANGAPTIIGSISYPFPLASAPTVHIIPAGNPTPVGCTGDVNNPGAASGHLCIFEGYAEGGVSLAGFFGPVDGVVGGKKLGVTIYATGGGIGNNDDSGTWAAKG